MSVLCNWLDVYMFVKFDTALCNADERYILLLLENLYPRAFLCVYRTLLLRAPLSCCLLEWCLERGIDIKEFNVFDVSQSLLFSVRHSAVTRSRLYSNLRTVRSLSLNQCSPEDMLLLSELIRHCNSLEGLTITHSEGAAEVCTVLIKISPIHLTSLNFSGCTDLSEYAVAMVLRRCPHIKQLAVTGCDDMSAVFIQSLVVWGQSISSLSISGCFQITCRYMLLLALHGRRPLEGLESDHCYDIVMRAFSGRLLGPSLRSLNLTYCHYHFSDQGVQCIERDCRYLTDLNLSHCRHVTDDAVDQLVLALPLLTSLNVSYIVEVSDHTLVDIGRCCPLLTDLDISHCYSVTDHGVLALTSRLTGIRVISLKCVYRITDKGLHAILVRYPGLSQLHGSWNLHLTNFCMSTIGARCHHLTSLSLATLSITNFTLLAILSSLYCGLVSLDINSNIRITDTALLSLANSRSGPTLTSLNVSYCEQISNRSLSAMARRCVKLTLLDIQGCTSIVDGEGICAIVKQCTRVKKIRAAGITLSMVGLRALHDLQYIVEIV